MSDTKRAKPAKRRQFFPLPITQIIEDPGVLALPTAAYGALFRMIVHFWATECRPLPSSDTELRHIARAHSPTWHGYRTEIFRIFNNLKPELENYHHARVNKLYNCTIAQNKGGAVTKAKALQARLASSVSLNDSAPVALPQCKQENRAAAIAERHAPKEAFNDTSR